MLAFDVHSRLLTFAPISPVRPIFPFGPIKPCTPFIPKYNNELIQNSTYLLAYPVAREDPHLLCYP
jgi:hypothetical protein